MSKINQRQNFATRLVKNPPDKFKEIFDTAPTALVVGYWGKSFEVLSANPAAVSLFCADDSSQFASKFDSLLARLPRKVILELLSARLKGDLYEAEFKLPTFRRNFIQVFMRLAYMPAQQVGAQHVVLSFQDVSAYKKQESFLKKLSQIDGLTQVLNQRTILRRLDEELSRARRYQVELSCVILDLDHFKAVNDTFGHLTGDRCLRRAAAMLREELRKTDIVGRYGGDEFLAILPETKPEYAVIPIERFLKNFDAKSEIKSKGKVVKTAFSVGISGYPFDGIESAQDLIKAADQALYLSKLAGGACCRVFTKK